MKKTTWRIALFDWIKAVAVINMVIYHALYDLVVLFGVRIDWYFDTPGFVWQQAICWSFILVSGAVWPLSRNPWRHAFTLLGCALVLSAVTALVMPAQTVWFGILHLLGCAALLTALLSKWLLRLPMLPCAIISFVLFLLTYSLPYRALTTSPYWFWLGLRTFAFTSSDYFPLLPWLFLYWTGLFLWRYLAPRCTKPLSRIPAPRIVTALSRRCLVIYMLHQPILYGIFLLLARKGILS